MSGKSLKEIRDMSFDELWRYCISAFGAWLLSILGGLGIALQNYLGVASLLTKVGAGTMYSVSIIGGLCGGAVNLFINISLLKKFFSRIIKQRNEKGELVLITPKPVFENNTQRVQYVIGILAFVCSGLLYGVMAFAIGSTGPLALLSFIVGILVAGISTIQEMETWLKKWDGKKPTPPEGTFLSRLVGNSLSYSEVAVLSILFAMGLITFFHSVGLPMIPAFVVGGAVGIGIGAFTQHTFYHGFLTEFCNSAKDKWAEFTSRKLWGIGGLISLINGAVNAALAYVGVSMLIGVICGAVGVAVPPLGAVLAFGITFAIIAGVASTILGVDFWIDNMPKKKDKAAPSIVIEGLDDDTESSARLDDNSSHDLDKDPSQISESTVTQFDLPKIRVDVTLFGKKDDHTTKHLNAVETSEINEEISSQLPAEPALLTSFSHFQPVKHEEIAVIENEAVIANKPANDRFRSRLINAASHFQPADRDLRQHSALHTSKARISAA